MTIEREVVVRRLADLHDEFERGQAMLADLERESSELRDALLRLAGAIQEIEGLLGSHDSGPAKIHRHD